MGKPLGNAQRLMDSLWTILRWYWKAAGKCQNSRCQPIADKAALPSGYWLKRGNFHPVSLSGPFSVYIYLKSKEQGNIFKTLIGSSTIFAVSIHTTFTLTQTDATAALNEQILFCRDSFCP